MENSEISTLWSKKKKKKKKKVYERSAFLRGIAEIYAYL